ncbi:unnamed protein product [Caenorhabditis bovis]|uniref:Saposin B-type domain-containing protein n=1 Tax=Caenorhabditis bovis TaxID=2654633 RepID=A0A8S1EDY9_9PELO|nr:unnamed protein product [Caenorhabditis bovis]
MLCQMITEPLEHEFSPSGAISAMFKKCNKMGLMEPICEQFVSENVKTIFARFKAGIPADTICQTMRFCEPV